MSFRKGSQIINPPASELRSEQESMIEELISPRSPIKSEISDEDQSPIPVANGASVNRRDPLEEAFDSIISSPLRRREAVVLSPLERREAFDTVEVSPIQRRAKHERHDEASPPPKAKKQGRVTNTPPTSTPAQGSRSPAVNGRLSRERKPIIVKDPATRYIGTYKNLASLRIIAKMNRTGHLYLRCATEDLAQQSAEFRASFKPNTQVAHSMVALDPAIFTFYQGDLAAATAIEVKALVLRYLTEQGCLDGPNELYKTKAEAELGESMHKAGEESGGFAEINVVEMEVGIFKGHPSVRVYAWLSAHQQPRVMYRIREADRQLTKTSRTMISLKEVHFHEYMNKGNIADTLAFIMSQLLQAVDADGADGKVADANVADADMADANDANEEPVDARSKIVVLKHPPPSRSLDKVYELTKQINELVDAAKGSNMLFGQPMGQQLHSDYSAKQKSRLLLLEAREKNVAEQVQALKNREHEVILDNHHQNRRLIIPKTLTFEEGTTLEDHFTLIPAGMPNAGMLIMINGTERKVFGKSYIVKSILYELPTSVTEFIPPAIEVDGVKVASVYDAYGYVCYTKGGLEKLVQEFDQDSVVHYSGRFFARSEFLKELVVDLSV